MTDRNRQIQPDHASTALAIHNASSHVRSLKLPPHPLSLGVVFSILLKIPWVCHRTRHGPQILTPSHLTSCAQNTLEGWSQTLNPPTFDL